MCVHTLYLIIIYVDTHPRSVCLLDASVRAFETVRGVVRSTGLHEEWAYVVRGAGCASLCASVAFFGALIDVIRYCSDQSCSKKTAHTAHCLRCGCLRYEGIP